MVPMIHPTLAYIDPGSGSLIIQAVIAAIVATPIFFRKQVGRLIGALRGRRDEPPPPGDRKRDVD
jgi:hypothetical protein